MDLKRCPICGKKILPHETKCQVRKSYSKSYRSLPFKIHYSCLMKTFWEDEGFDIEIEEDDFEYLNIGEHFDKNKGYKKVWKYGIYVLKKGTQEEFEHYKAMHLRNLAKKELTKA